MIFAIFIKDMLQSVNPFHRIQYNDEVIIFLPTFKELIELKTVNSRLLS